MPPVTHANLIDVFSNHQPSGEDFDHYNAIRQSATTFAETVLNHTTLCEDQQDAIRYIRMALDKAKAAVALKAKI
jgi:hypothetical protein